MAHHKSAKKRVRSNTKKNERNHQYLSSVRTAIKTFRHAMDEVLEGSRELGSTKTLLTNAQKMLAKAGSKGVIHKNTASKGISRLAKLLAKTEKNASAPASEKPKAKTKAKVKTKAKSKKKTTKKSTK